MKSFAAHAVRMEDPGSIDRLCTRTHPIRNMFAGCQLQLPVSSDMTHKVFRSEGLTAEQAAEHVAKKHNVNEYYFDSLFKVQCLIIYLRPLLSYS